jgi:predicted TIM-barrel fold metal-dependent hydrolase
LKKGTPHARPIKQAAELMKTCPNVYCDTAFIDICEVKYLMREGLSSKIFFGSDFPITHYRNGKQGTLEAQYKKDIERMAGLGILPNPLKQRLL